MSRDFEMVQSRRDTSVINQGDVSVSPSIKNNSLIEKSIADNLSQILNIASDIVEIEKIKVKSEAVIKAMTENRKNLLAEAEAYVKKINAETDRSIQKMQIIRDLMRDFYQYNNNANLSGEDFSRIISSIVSEMGQL